MTKFTVLVLAVMLLGVCLILISLVLLIGAGKRRRNNPVASDQDADRVLEELNKTATAIFEELEEKRQELMVLFYMIEDRKKELTNDLGEPPVKEKASEREKLRSPFMPAPDNKAVHRIGKVHAMQAKGMSDEQIAKSLGIGQGEVKLILNLGKEN